MTALNDFILLSFLGRSHFEVGTRVRVLKAPSVKATQLTVGTSISGTIAPPLLMTIAKAFRLQ